MVAAFRKAETDMNWIAGRFTAFLLTLAGAAITAVLAATASLW
jgi:hypothetical protein